MKHNLCGSDDFVLLSNQFLWICDLFWPHAYFESKKRITKFTIKPTEKHYFFLLEILWMRRTTWTRDVKKNCSKIKLGQPVYIAQTPIWWYIHFFWSRIFIHISLNVVESRVVILEMNRLPVLWWPRENALYACASRVVK